MQDKAEAIAFLSIILSVILFFALPIQDIWYAILLLCVGFSIALIKKMWGLAGWASDTVEKLK